MAAPTSGIVCERLALVSGAGSGIGRAVIERLARAGWRVIALDYSHARLAELQCGPDLDGALVGCVEGDASLEGTWAEARDLIEKLGGAVAFLCNNVGVASYGSVLACTPDEWDRVIRINLTSTFLGCRTVIPLMIARGGGSIVNIASDVGVTPARDRLVYSVSKAAVIHLTRQIAADCARWDIRVNAVAPAAVDSELFLAGVEESAEAVAAQKAKLADQIPLGRLASTSEVAEAVVWLGSEAASFTTGSVLPVDGGTLAAK